MLPNSDEFTMKPLHGWKDENVRKEGEGGGQSNGSYLSILHKVKICVIGDRDWYTLTHTQ